jgi:4-amino-4-deoxy-L-arabinose transferase-like glycosyltransferase
MVNIKHQHYAWLSVTLLALGPLWLVGMFDRGYWTPDEPREADIVWRMSIQADHTLPQLADAPFLEKPPLSYWLAAVSMHVVGDTATAARIPNLLYAIISTISIGMLVFSMAGAVPAAVAAIAAGSAFNSYQVAIWLAPDAGLLAGCALALLGLYRGYVANTSRSKLLWYTLMHVGALIGFMAKSGPGWIFPGLTFLVLIAWERRWDELKRWQLWAGLGVQLLAIGAWIVAVWHEPQGLAALRILFWNNLAGRFTDLHATGALDYASAHKNWLGKYLVELPYYVFPWTLLVVAALYRAWSAVRMQGRDGTPWRFAVAASVPFLMLLSLASTARSIYAAPALLGLFVLVGLWSREVSDKPSRPGELAVSATRYCVCLFALLMVVAIGIMYLAEASKVMGAALVAVVALTIYATWRSVFAQRQRQLNLSLGWTYMAYAACIAIGGSVLFPQVDQWQDLASLAQAINIEAKGHPLALLRPDETTIAILDHQLRTPYATIEGLQQDESQLTAQWLRKHPDDGLILINLPGHAAGKLTELLNRVRHQKPLSDGLLLSLQQDHIAQVVARYDLPQGRRYVLIESVHLPALTHVDVHVQAECAQKVCS